MASASNGGVLSLSTPRWTYDVFLSFCSEGTHKGFAERLHAALQEKGINVFRDHESLEKEEYLYQERLTVIQKAEYTVVVLSGNYPFSKRCLMELAKILEYRRERRLTVFPIFYHVVPSDVREENGIFAEALTKHKAAPKADVDAWRSALKEVGGLAGWDVEDRNESIVIEEICGAILNGLSRNLTTFDKGFTLGIEFQVKEMMILLCKRRDDVRFIGICGLRGIGKTTLAKLLYKIVVSQFQGSCFLSCIRERFNNLVDLQKQLVCEILDKKFLNHYQVGEVIENKLQDKKVFIVLDDINKEEQLEALARRHDWFCPGSRILITSWDRHPLNGYVDEIFEPEELSDDDALQLFSWNAFGKHHPEENYMELSREIMRFAGGIPFVLQIYGAFLSHQPLNAWLIASHALRLAPPPQTWDKLEICFGELEYSQKMVFLDIACFFNGEYINDVYHKLKCLGYHPEVDIRVLQDKYLIKETTDGRIQMNDLLVKLGQQIVHRMSPHELGQRTRLWQCEDIVYVLKNNVGSNVVESIMLKLPLPKPEQLNFEAFSKMKNLKMLVIRPETFGQHGAHDEVIVRALQTVKWYGDASKFKLSKKMSVLEWWGYPLNFLPIGFESRKQPTHDVRLYFQLNPRL